MLMSIAAAMKINHTVNIMAFGARVALPLSLLPARSIL
jgi:hypothetical protein